MNELMILLALFGTPSFGSDSKAAMEPTVKRLTIRKGATLKETLIAFGRPYEASEETSYADGHQYLQLIYVNDVCSGSSCSVILNAGVVTRFIGVKTELSL